MPPPAVGNATLQGVHAVRDRRRDLRPARGPVGRFGNQAAASSATGRSASARNAPARQAMRIAIAVTATMIVEIALLSGVTPNLIAP
jgi:hypothetical protein